MNGWVDQVLKNSSGIANVVMPGSMVGGFGVSKQMKTALGTTVAFAPGMTLWLSFYGGTGTVAATTEPVLLSGNGISTKGWHITRGGADQGSNQGFLFFLSNGAFKVLTPLSVSMNGAKALGFINLCIRWRASDNDLAVSINGSALTSLGTITAAAQDGTCQASIGSNIGAILNLTTGGVVNFAIWNREASSAEAKANTFTTGNRFVWPAAVTGDAATTVEWNARRDWDGSAGTTTSHGSSPVTYTVTGSPTLTDVTEIRIPTSDPLYWNGKVSIPKTGYTIRDAFSTLKFLTDTTRIGFEMYNTENVSQAAFAAVVGVYSNGTYQSSFQTLATQTFYNVDAILPAGSGKTVQLWEGPKALATINSQLEESGTFIGAVRLPLGTNSSALFPTAPSKRLVILGDSIITAWYASVPHQTAPIPLLRADFPGAAVTGHCGGSFDLYTLASDQATANAAAALIATELDGTVANYVWIQLGTNDYGAYNNGAGTNFGIGYGRLVDAIHALVPGAIIYCQSPYQRISPASEAANGFGSTLGNYRTQISNVAAARPSFCVYVEGGNHAIVADAHMYTDGLHVTDAGMTDIKNVIKTTIGY